jgi:magnesium-transporting ATPase (P-type)
VQLLKARCGHGGLRVLALAYKDLLLQPTSSSGLTAAAVAGSGPQQQQQQQRVADWQLLDDDDEQQDLVLIGLLALEDPGKSDMECMLTIFRF